MPCKPPGATSRGCAWCESRVSAPGAAGFGLEARRLCRQPFDEMVDFFTRQQRLAAGKLVGQLALAVEPVNVPMAGVAEP